MSGQTSLVPRPPSARNKLPLPSLSTILSSAPAVSSSDSSGSTSPPADVQVVQAQTQTQQQMSALLAMVQVIATQQAEERRTTDERLMRIERNMEEIKTLLANVSQQLLLLNPGRTTPSIRTLSAASPEAVVPVGAPAPSNAAAATHFHLDFDPAECPPPVEIKFDVFLSHRRVDAGDLMRSFKSELSSLGYSAYLDRDDLNSTNDLMTSVAASKTLLFFMSQKIFDSEWCLKELCQAVRYNRNILLVSEAGCWWLDAQQNIVEFPLFLFRQYAVEHGATNGIAVSFHRDFFQVVISKIVARLGTPLSQVSRAAAAAVAQATTASAAANVPTATSQLSRANLAAQEAAMNAKIDEVNNTSRAAAKELIRHVSILSSDSCTEEQAEESIKLLGESASVKSLASQPVRESAIKALMSSVSRFTSNAKLIKLGCASMSNVYSNENADVLAREELWSPFVSLLRSSHTSQNVIKELISGFHHFTFQSSNGKVSDDTCRRVEGMLDERLHIGDALEQAHTRFPAATVNDYNRFLEDFGKSKWNRSTGTSLADREKWVGRLVRAQLASVHKCDFGFKSLHNLISSHPQETPQLLATFTQQGGMRVVERIMKEQLKHFHWSGAFEECFDFFKFLSVQPDSQAKMKALNGAELLSPLVAEAKTSSVIGSRGLQHIVDIIKNLGGKVGDLTGVNLHITPKH